ncbi:hypothetical protein FF38_10110 [Lucilia cuprina]|uniref:Uncharacterized protein n=1 Tax=Lucilia cuprina TaxID=7375 RepID=A0A0L0CRW9_LUCCU|nr:hypothetical protein FF38_10110 [Lucilia cuprina]
MNTHSSSSLRVSSMDLDFSITSGMTVESFNVALTGPCTSTLLENSSYLISDHWMASVDSVTAPIDITGRPKYDLSYSQGYTVLILICTEYTLHISGQGSKIQWYHMYMISFIYHHSTQHTSHLYDTFIREKYTTYSLGRRVGCFCAVITSQKNTLSRVSETNYNITVNER